MRVKNAIALLSKFGTIRRSRGEYRAKVGRGERVIRFIDRAGKVTRLQMQEPGERPWPLRSVLRAIQHALARGRTAPVSKGPHKGMLVSACVGRRGRALTPWASFLAVSFGGATPLVEGDEWGDDDALACAARFVDGRLDAASLLIWLEGRGGTISQLLQSRR